MKCIICGNEINFIIITRERHVGTYNTHNKSYVLTEPKILSAEYFCNSKQCENNNVKVE